MEERRFTSDPDREVTCRICAVDGVDYRTKASRLIGHIGGKHSKDGWSKSRYLNTFADGGAESDFAFFVPPESTVQKSRLQMQEVNAKRALESAPAAEPYEAPTLQGMEGDSVADPNVALLTPPERTFYQEYHSQIFQAVDRDEMQSPAISSLVLDVIMLQRARSQQIKESGKKSPTYNEELEKAISSAEKRIQTSMKALGISREMLLKNQDKIKSTPAGLISGYLDEIENLSPEALDALVIDEKRVLARMHPRVQKFILDNAPDLKPEQEDDDAGDGTVLGLEAALKRAGISF